MRLRRLAGRQVPQAFALGRNPDEICGPPPPAFGLLPTFRAGELPFGELRENAAHLSLVFSALRATKMALNAPLSHVGYAAMCPRLRRGSKGSSPAQSVGGGWASPPTRSTRLGALQPLGRLPSGGSPRPSMRPLGAGTFQAAAARRLCYAVPLPCPSCCAAGSGPWGRLAITWPVLRGANVKWGRAGSDGGLKNGRRDNNPEKRRCCP